MRRGIMAFMLGIVVAWIGLPAGIHRLYWLLIVVAALAGYFGHRIIA
jgi:hypothetical protein